MIDDRAVAAAWQTAPATAVVDIDAVGRQAELLQGEKLLVGSGGVIWCVPCDAAAARRAQMLLLQCCFKTIISPNVPIPDLAAHIGGVVVITGPEAASWPAGAPTGSSCSPRNEPSYAS